MTRKLDPYTLRAISRRLLRESRDWLVMAMEPHLSDEVKMRRRSIHNIMRSVARDLASEARTLTRKPKRSKAR